MGLCELAGGGLSEVGQGVTRARAQVWLVAHGRRRALEGFPRGSRGAVGRPRVPLAFLTDGIVRWQMQNPC